ncbi:MAG: YraN family protein [Cycloclasticus sp.]|nr:YraN family protein [Cycloclasticus sp. 46_120_T64]
MADKHRHNQLGQEAEDLALGYLQQQGLTLIERNYRSRYGEIDLIMRDQQHIVFVEVRFRSSQRYGGALSSVDIHKQRKLIKCAQQYIANTPSRLGFRFDVLAISPSSQQHDIQWLTNAFDEF